MKTVEDVANKILRLEAENQSLKAELEKYKEMKENSKVYVVEDNQIQEWFISRLEIAKEANNAFIRYTHNIPKTKNIYEIESLKIDCFGKSWFLTKEEAEAKLEELCQ